MQGNLTDEEVANAYIKYFEDFAQLVSLKIADIYSTDNKVYILGRTIAEPYTYYYRIGNLKSDMNSQQWESWQKIELQIPVEMARIINAFGRLFIFWLQKTEKEKQIEDMLIDDSTLVIHYAFYKIDNSWSAQQKLPLCIRRDYQYEERMRGYLNEIDSHKQHIAERKEDDSANTYCRDEIKRYKNLIKKEVKNLKSIQFNGKVDVGFYGSDRQEILIISREDGFSNSKFTLKENLESTTSYVSYFKDDNSSVDTAVVAAKESIASNYKELRKKYEEEIENKKEIIKVIKKREQAFSELKKEITERERLDKEADSIIQQLTDISINPPSIKETVTRLKEYIIEGSKIGLEEGNKLAEDLKNKLSTLTSEDSINGTGNNELKGIIASEGFLISAADLLNRQAKKDILQSVGSYLLQSLPKINDQGNIEQLKTRVRDVLSEVDKLETEAADIHLENELKDIMRSDTISVTDLLEEGQVESNSKLLIKIQDVLKKRIEDIKKIVEDIKNLKQPEKAIGNLKNEKDEFKKEKLKLKNQREELEKDVDQGIIEERKREFNKKEEEENSLIESIIRERKGNNKSYASEEILRLIKTLYKEAYIKGTSAILAPEKQKELKFEGFYGVYLWEIFFYIPTLVAYLFNQEQKFAEARKWY